MMEKKKRGRPPKARVEVVAHGPPLPTEPIVLSRASMESPAEPIRTIVKVDPEALIARAIDKGLPLESLERLLAMRRELKAEWAREQYFKALSGFQKECPVIGKGKEVHSKDGKLRYKYAPLDEIIGQVKVALEAWGFSYTVQTSQTDKAVTSVCHAHHVDGHSETSEFTIPMDPEAYMNESQKIASAMTYAKRYAFCNSFGIMTGDMDDDANGTGGPLEKLRPAKAPDETTITGKPLLSLGNRLTTLIASPFLTEEDRVKIRGEYRATCTTDKRRGEYLLNWENIVEARKQADMSGAEKAFFEDQNKPLPGEKVYEVGAK